MKSPFSLLTLPCTVLIVSANAMEQVNYQSGNPDNTSIVACADAWPAMIGMNDNGILKISLKDLPKNAKEISLHLDFSKMENINDIDHLSLIEGHDNDIFFIDPYEKIKNKTSYPGKKLVSNIKPTKNVILKGEILPSDSNGERYLWVSVKMKPTASIDRKIKFSLKDIKIDGTSYTADTPLNAQQRVGVALCKTGTEVQGKPSIKNRIPGIVRTPKGTLVAVYDARYDRTNDMPSNIDIVTCRSTDGGQTWSQPKIAINYTGNDEKGKPIINKDNNYSNDYGVSDPCILTDPQTGNIWVGAVAKKGIFDSKPGLSDQESSQYVITHSTDDGQSFEPYRSITPEIKNPKWRTIFQGPGHGIATKPDANGKSLLIMPSQIWYMDNAPHSCLIYSDDQGKTWKSNDTVGKDIKHEGIPASSSENCIVELADGSLMINARNEARQGYRHVYTTKDLGKTWQSYESETLPEPSCQASIIAVDKVPNLGRALFFSNPNVNKAPRQDMTVKTSVDEGKTWPKNMQVKYDARPSCGYSDLCIASPTHLGIIYEGIIGDENIFFLRIPFEEIVNQDNKQ